MLNILGGAGKINALIGLLRDVREVLAFEADAYDSSRCGDMVATIDEFMGWSAPCPYMPDGDTSCGHCDGKSVNVRPGDRLALGGAECVALSAETNEEKEKANASR